MGNAVGLRSERYTRAADPGKRCPSLARRRRPYEVRVRRGRKATYYLLRPRGARAPRGRRSGGRTAASHGTTATPRPAQKKAQHKHRRLERRGAAASLAQLVEEWSTRADFTVEKNVSTLPCPGLCCCNQRTAVTKKKMRFLRKQEDTHSTPLSGTQQKSSRSRRSGATRLSHQDGRPATARPCSPCMASSHGCDSTRQMGRPIGTV